MNLLKNVDIEGWALGQTESTTINSRLVDCSNADGVMFIAVGSSVYAGTGVTVKVQGSTASSTSSMYTLSGSGSTSAATLATTHIAAKSNGRLTIVDVHKPIYRYNRLQINASSSGHIVNIIAIKYNVRRPGSTGLWDSTTIAGSTLIVPTS